MSNKRLKTETSQQIMLPLLQWNCTNTVGLIINGLLSPCGNQAHTQTMTGWWEQGEDKCVVGICSDSALSPSSTCSEEAGGPFCFHVCQTWLDSRWMPGLGWGSFWTTYPFQPLQRGARSTKVLSCGWNILPDVQELLVGLEFLWGQEVPETNKYKIKTLSITTQHCKI